MALRRCEGRKKSQGPPERPLHPVAVFLHPRSPAHLLVSRGLACREAAMYCWLSCCWSLEWTRYLQSWKKIMQRRPDFEKTRRPNRIAWSCLFHCCYRCRCHCLSYFASKGVGGLLQKDFDCWGQGKNDFRDDLSFQSLQKILILQEMQVRWPD